jgi:two-component system cell cycle sensor histidine kinase/response regulator CckA
MLAVAVFNGVASVLQLTVPSYGLRLVRRYGSQRVGWFLVTSFLVLAVLHLMEPLNPVSFGPAFGTTLDLLYAVSSVLLLVGMCHMEALFSESDQSLSKEEQLRLETETRAKEEAEELSRTNQELLRKVATFERTEKALRDSEAQYRSLFSDNPQPMWVYDPRTLKFLAVNHAALALYGFSQNEFMNFTVKDILPEAMFEKFVEDSAKPCSGPQTRGQWKHCRKDRAVMDVDITALDMRYGGAAARLVLARDVTETLRTDARERHERKMDLIAQVASGVARHFQPVFSTIESQMTVMLQHAPEARFVDPLRKISAAATRGGAVARQLLATSGSHSMCLESLDLNEVMRNLEPWLRQLAGDEIVLQTIYGALSFQIRADQNLIEHLIINLVSNARDSMPSGGTITMITTGVRVADFQSGDSSNSREFVRLTIRDNGIGMPPEIQEHVFEPFYTTKEAGTASGLGLASVYGIVKQLSGWVEFASQPGAGTEFRIFFPCAPAVTVASPEAARVATTSSRGTILLVEPDDRLRGLARCILNWNGYSVVEANCASTALSRWETQSHKIDVLLTDMDLQGDISGRELAARLKAVKPDLKLVYTSTATQNGDGPAPEEAALVSKPYTAEKLVQAVQG